MTKKALFRVLLAVLCASAAFAAQAQYSAPAIRAQVIDAESGAPLEGVHVVARWEWLDYRATIHGEPYVNNGGVLHSAEAVTGHDGRFEIAGWMGLAKLTGHLDDHADPKLSLFSSGYTPLELRNQGWTDYMHPNPAMRRDSEWNGKTIALHKFVGTPRAYAELIRKFQGDYRDGLWWPVNTATDSMPRMILALHREKARLGDDGERVMGANLLPGRSGEGRLLDADTGKAVSPAVLSITWTMRREGAAETRTLVQQKRSGVEGASERFFVSPWRTPAPTLPGWEVAYDRLPLVRAYAHGYRKTADRQWKGGDVIRMRKLPEGREALLAELRTWRSDIDEALARAPNREEALDSQWLLVTTLDDECRTLTADVHAGICFAPDSELGRFAAKARTQQREMWETVDGARPLRIVAAGVGSARAVATPATPAVGVSSPQAASAYDGPPQVRGFSIEPRKP